VPCIHAPDNAPGNPVGPRGMRLSHPPLALGRFPIEKAWYRRVVPGYDEIPA